MKITKPCQHCGTPVTRVPSQMRANVFCGLRCSRIFLSKRMSEMNAELNPTRMTTATKVKLRNARFGKGTGKSYSKTFGRHTHRIVAEKILGRSLKKDEVVHHIDADKLNNDPLNLMIFPSQKEHAAWHKNEEYDNNKNFE